MLKLEAMRGFIILFLIFSLFIASPAHAFWIWSPKTGKWLNPKSAVKPTPEEQLDYALEYYNQDKIDEARREFRKLLKSYPKSTQAAEAQFYLGMIEEKKARLYEAFLAYQKVIDKYPFSSRIDEVIEKEFRIAEKFMQGEKRKALGINLPVENPAIEIFRKVVNNSSFGRWAPEAQYKLGLLLKSQSRFYEAEEEFSKVIKNYPKSEWVTAAEFQVASCRASIAPDPDYNQEAMREAKESFEDFILSHPDAELSQEAERNIRQLKEKEAQGYFDAAEFYEKQKAYNAAKIYYNIVIDDYPKTQWAAQAFSKLQELEKKDEEQ